MKQGVQKCDHINSSTGYMCFAHCAFFIEFIALSFNTQTCKKESICGVV